MLLPAARANEPEILPLWSDSDLGITADTPSATEHDRGPNNRSLTNIQRPTLTVYHPDPSTNHGAALVVCPGGGYGGLAVDKEGHDVAKWFSKLGGTAGVLSYRLGGGPHQHPVPRNDARQAVALMRQHAGEWNVSPDRVGIVGFSAGGHLASTIATDPQTGVNFAALIYPVISMRDGVTHGGSKKNLLGPKPNADVIAEMSRDEQVSTETCPTFLVHAGDDRAVIVENSLRFYRACIDHDVPVEMHLFPNGGHGFGMYRGDRPVDHWPDLMQAWMIQQGFLKRQ